MLSFSRHLLLILCLATTGAFSQLADDAAPLTDGQIARIVQLGTAAHVAFSLEAISKAQNEEVLGFAKRTTKIFMAMYREAGTLFGRNALFPAGSELSQQIADRARTQYAQLKRLRGSEFDRVYMDTEVQELEACLRSINTVLLPSVVNADLKGLLEKALLAIETELNDAMAIRDKVRE